METQSSMTLAQQAAELMKQANALANQNIKEVTHELSKLSMKADEIAQEKNNIYHAGVRECMKKISASIDAEVNTMMVILNKAQ